jgi:hypothetical protein
VLESVLSQIDQEIAKLQEAKRLLQALESGPARRPGRPAKSAPSVTQAPTGATKSTTLKKRTISIEARERMRQAQIKRWAATKKSTK